jgi:thiol-disulfide isomerase/thioredoxin
MIGESSRANNASPRAEESNMRTATTLLLIALAGCSEKKDTSGIRTLEFIEEAIDLKPVKVAELEKLVAEQKGKVVVLDIWFLGCAPCVKKFPSFVELHNTYAADGLVCMSVDVEMNENEKRDKVLEFLKEKGAGFTNLIIDDKELARDAWQERNDANATPSYVVYNRKGERVPVNQSIKAEEMTKLVKKLLAEK